MQMLIPKFVFCLLLCVYFFANILHATEENTNEQYDAALAKKLGADEYGMKQYVMVTLLSADDSHLSAQEREKAFAGHFENMAKLAKAGHLVLAGPFVDAKPKRGLFVFNTDDIEQARQWANSDPAVAAGIFTFELDKIYNSAALMLINDNHNTLAKKKM